MKNPPVTLVQTKIAVYKDHKIKIKTVKPSGGDRHYAKW